MPTTERQRHQVMKMDLEQARRALLVAMAADIPCAMWGEAGFAKSATNDWVAKTVQRRMFDVRLSYYEETDLAGYPTDPTADLELAHPIKPNFRTLEMASDLIKTAEALEDAGVTIDGEPLTTADLVVPMLAGTVTVGPAVQIYALHKAAIGEREIDQILEHPETAPVQDNGRTWLIGNALLRRVQSTRARCGQNSTDVLEAADQTAAYARRLPAEVATWLMRDLVRHAPEAATVRNYQAWSNANQ